MATQNVPTQTVPTQPMPPQPMPPHERTGRSVLSRSLIPALVLGLTLFAPTAAWADDDAPVKRKITIKKKAATANKAVAAKKSPMDTLHRWLMGEITKGVGGAAGDGQAQRGRTRGLPDHPPHRH